MVLAVSQVRQRTRLWVLDCTLSLGLQKVTLEAVFLTPFGT